MSRTLFVLLLTCLPMLAACQTQQVAPPAPVPVVSAVPPAPELADLRFMTGRWKVVNQNGSVAEEHWMPGRGKAMMGMFRLVRATGEPQFFEVMSVTVEPEGVMLRLRHFHGQLDVQDNETEAQVYRLTAATTGRAVFTAVAHTREVASVTYFSEKPDQLTVDVAFDATAKGRGFKTVYTRDPH